MRGFSPSRRHSTRARALGCKVVTPEPPLLSNLSLTRPHHPRVRDGASSSPRGNQPRRARCSCARAQLCVFDLPARPSKRALPSIRGGPSEFGFHVFRWSSLKSPLNLRYCVWGASETGGEGEDTPAPTHEWRTAMCVARLLLHCYTFLIDVAPTRATKTSSQSCAPLQVAHSCTIHPVRKERAVGENTDHESAHAAIRPPARLRAFVSPPPDPSLVWDAAPAA